jgi:hypothetical protein
VRGAGVRRRHRWPVGAGQFRATRECTTHGDGGLGANVGGRPWVRQSQGCSGGRARSAGDSAWARTPGAAALFGFHLALFEPIFLQIFELKWSKR